MTPEEKKAREIVQIIQNKTTWCCEFESDYITAEKQIALALKEAYNSGLERCKRIVEEADPLEAIADWDNSDDIAFAVQKFLLKAIRKEKR